MPVREQFIVKQDPDATITVEVFGTWGVDSEGEPLFDGIVQKFYVAATPGLFDCSLENGSTRLQQTSIGDLLINGWVVLKGVARIPFEEFRFDITRRS